MVAHKLNQGKTLQLREERFTEIERENRILYEKMLNVHNRKPNLDNLMITTGKGQHVN